MQRRRLLTLVNLVFILLLGIKAQAQGVPEILYYKFNGSGKYIRNMASNPPSGTSVAQVYGGLAQGPSGACGGSALIGSGATSNTDYVDTKWATRTVGSWSITFWTSGLDSSTTLYYLFSDINAGAFRCFSGGVAGAGNLLLRGPFSDVLLTGGASKRPSVAAFVYDSTAGYIYAYLNGKLINSVSQSTISMSTSGTLILSGYNSLNGLNLGGIMDEFRFYKRALSASDIQKLAYTGNSTSTITRSAKCSYTGPSGFNTWNRSGTYKDTLLNSVNCDSVITINLTITGNTSSTQNLTVCDYLVSPGKKFIWTKSGTYNDVIKNAAGCDSLMTINLTVRNSNGSTQKVNVCNSYRSPSGKYTWTTTGVYSDTLLNRYKCDSVLTINLTVYTGSQFSQNVKTCDQYKSPSGKYVWKTSGTYRDTVRTKFGCDSVIVTNLTLLKSSTKTLNVKQCEAYRSPSKKYVWTQSGTYRDTLTNAVGCDSVLTINLTVTRITQANVDLKGCGKVVSPSGKYIWNFSGVYNDTIPNAAGCDSIMFIDVKINTSTSGSSFKTGCVTYVSPSGKYIWTKSGKYYDTIPNRNGCDSFLTITLTLNTVDINVTRNNATLTASANGATYQWLNCNTNFSILTGETGKSFTAKVVGDYAVKVTENGCTDTSLCYKISSLGIESARVSELTVFPNPAGDLVRITSSYPLSRPVIRLLDLSGRTIFVSAGNSGYEQTLDIHTIPAGVYFVEIQDGDITGRARFIKN